MMVLRMRFLRLGKWPEVLARLSLLDPVLNYFEGKESEKGQCF